MTPKSVCSSQLKRQVQVSEVLHPVTPKARPSSYFGRPSEMSHTTTGESMQVLSYLLHVDPYLQLLVSHPFQLFKPRMFLSRLCCTEMFLCSCLVCSMEEAVEKCCSGMWIFTLPSSFSTEKISGFWWVCINYQSFHGRGIPLANELPSSKDILEISQNIILIIKKASPGLLVLLPVINSKRALLS